MVDTISILAIAGGRRVIAAGVGPMSYQGLTRVTSSGRWSETVNQNEPVLILASTALTWEDPCTREWSIQEVPL